MKNEKEWYFDVSLLEKDKWTPKQTAQAFIAMQGMLAYTSASSTEPDKIQDPVLSEQVSTVLDKLKELAVKNPEALHKYVDPCLELTQKLLKMERNVILMDADMERACLQVSLNVVASAVDNELARRDVLIDHYSRVGEEQQLEDYEGACWTLYDYLKGKTLFNYTLDLISNKFKLDAHLFGYHDDSVLEIVKTIAESPSTQTETRSGMTFKSLLADSKEKNFLKDEKRQLDSLVKQSKQPADCLKEADPIIFGNG